MEETGPWGGSTGEPQGFGSVPGFENKPEQKSGGHGRHPRGGVGQVEGVPEGS